MWSLLEGWRWCGWNTQFYRWEKEIAHLKKVDFWLKKEQDVEDLEVIHRFHPNILQVENEVFASTIQWCHSLVPKGLHRHQTNVVQMDLWHQASTLLFHCLVLKYLLVVVLSNFLLYWYWNWFIESLPIWKSQHSSSSKDSPHYMNESWFLHKGSTYIL